MAFPFSREQSPQLQKRLALQLLRWVVALLLKPKSK
jgi:hypothetical protein